VVSRGLHHRERINGIEQIASPVKKKKQNTKKI